MIVAVHTLGCRLNQYESESLIHAFVRSSIEVVSLEEPADFYILNTCTVTSKSDQEARRLIRKLMRERKGCPIVVTGCYAEGGIEESLTRESDQIVVFPRGAKERLIHLPAWLKSQGDSEDLRAQLLLWHKKQKGEDPLPFGDFETMSRRAGRTRGYLKIQDGCNSRCTFCRVCLVRGPSVCLKADQVCRKAVKLEELGYREIVLTGVNLGAYESEGTDLVGLISKILQCLGKRVRIRLSSISPHAVTPALEKFWEDVRLCRHLHLSIQSGSDEILQKMGRPYRANTVREIVKRLRKRGHDLFIGADFIVGFPGEGDRAFQETSELVEELQLAGIHVFPFSPRPGTSASSMRPQVPERIRTQRGKKLRYLAEIGEEAYRQRFLGKSLGAVLEKRQGDLWISSTDNNLRLRVRGVPNTENSGSLVMARAERVVGSLVEGSYLGTP